MTNLYEPHGCGCSVDSLLRERDEARAEIAVLLARIAAVRALHVDGACECGCGRTGCSGCNGAELWPCPTLVAAGVSVGTATPGHQT